MLYEKQVKGQAFRNDDHEVGGACIKVKKVSPCATKGKIAHWHDRMIQTEDTAQRGPW